MYPEASRQSPNTVYQYCPAWAWRERDPPPPPGEEETESEEKVPPSSEKRPRAFWFENITVL